MSILSAPFLRTKSEVAQCNGVAVVDSFVALLDGKEVQRGAHGHGTCWETCRTFHFRQEAKADLPASSMSWRRFGVLFPEIGDFGLSHFPIASMPAWQNFSSLAGSDPPQPIAAITFPSFRIGSPP